MIFCAAVSSSTGGGSVASGAVFASAMLGASTVTDSTGALIVGDAGFAGVSREALMREIGGKTSRFGFGSPCSAFLLGFFRSMSETLSASWPGGRADSGAGFEGRGVGGFATGATFWFNIYFGSFVLASVTGL